MQEVATQEIARQEVTRQYVARQEVLRYDVEWQKAASQETARGVVKCYC